MTSKTALKACLLAAAGLTPFAALAARAADPVPAASPESLSQVQEVIVTIQKRAQNKIDVPIALTAETGDFLQRMGIYDLHDAMMYVPGVYEENHSVNDPVFVIRGQSTDDLGPTSDPRITLFQDGVDISRQAGSYTELFDMQRIEVSKGPQTTLFGRSAEVGAISEIQNKADPSSFDWSLRAEGGNYNENLFQGMVNIPLSEDFAVRAAFSHRDRDGYIDNLSGGGALNSIDADAGRIGFTYRSGDRINANLIFNYERDAPTSESFKSGTFEPTNPTTGAVLGNLSPYSPAYLAGSLDGKSLGLRREVYGVTALIDLKLNDAFSLHSTSAYRKFDGEEVFDPDGFSFPLLTVGDDEWQHQVSQDVRLNWNPGGAFSGFVGASYFSEYVGYRIPELYDEPELLALLTGTLSRTNPNPGPAAFYSLNAVEAPELQGLVYKYSNGHYLLSTPQAQAIANNLGMHQEESTTGASTDAYDVYGDFSWKATSKLTLDAGLRYTNERKTTTFSSQVDGSRSILGGALGAAELIAEGGPYAAEGAGILNALAVPGAATIPESAGYPVPYFGLQDQPTAGTSSASTNDSQLTWRVNASYKLTPLQNVYFSYGRGELPGSISAGPPATPGGAAVFTKASPEKLDSYEVGYKGLILNRHLELEGALFYYNYSDFQIPVLVGTTFVTEDAGQATDYGFEGQATWRFNRWFDAFGTYTYNHGRFDTGAYKGNQFRQNPENAFTLGATARYFALGGTFDFTPSYMYRSKVFFEIANDNPNLTAGQLLPPLQHNEVQDGYGLLNLRAGFAPNKAHWRVELFCANCTNTQYLKDAGDTGEDIGIPAYVAGEPRTFGISVTIRR
jgi:outer membrane receptor protein involved in Fe transport